MKNILLFVLMFGMVFSQDVITTREYAIPITSGMVGEQIGENFIGEMNGLYEMKIIYYEEIEPPSNIESRPRLSFIGIPDGYIAALDVEEIRWNWNGNGDMNIGGMNAGAKKLMFNSEHPIIIGQYWELEPLPEGDFSGTLGVRITGRFDGDGDLSSSGSSEMMPSSVSLKQNHPNPFNPITTIEYEMQQNCNVNVSIYDIKGELVEKLIDGYNTTGKYSIQWNPKNISSGQYFYQISVDGFVQTKKMVLLK